MSRLPDGLVVIRDDERGDEAGGALDRARDARACLAVHVDELAALRPDGAQVGVVVGAWAAGRWRFEHRGDPAPAGVAMAGRADPLLTHAMTVLAANKQARTLEARATFTRVDAAAGGAGTGGAGAARAVVVPDRVLASVTAWLDARAPDGDRLDALVEGICAQGGARADRDGTHLDIVEEARRPEVAFDAGLARSVARGFGDLGPVPALTLPSAGGFAALQSAGVPTVCLVIDPRIEPGAREAIIDRAIAGITAEWQEIDGR